MSDRRIYSILAMAGVTPFVASAILLLAGIASIEPLGPLAGVAASYGLAIVSFLTGIHWVFVAVWLAYAIGSIGVALAAQVLALLVLLGIDRWLMNNGVITPHYYRTRGVATILATLSLAILIGTS